MSGSRIQKTKEEILWALIRESENEASTAQNFALGLSLDELPGLWTLIRDSENEASTAQNLALGFSFYGLPGLWTLIRDSVKIGPLSSNNSKELEPQIQQKDPGL